MRSSGYPGLVERQGAQSGVTVPRRKSQREDAGLKNPALRLNLESGAGGI